MICTDLHSTTTYSNWALVPRTAAIVVWLKHGWCKDNALLDVIRREYYLPKMKTTLACIWNTTITFWQRNRHSAHIPNSFPWKNYFHIDGHYFYDTKHPEKKAHGDTGILIRFLIKHFSQKNYCKLISQTFVDDELSYTGSDFLLPSPRWGSRLITPEGGQL